MKTIKTATADELRDLRAAIRDAIEAMAWFDLMADQFGLRQSGAEWSAAAEALRKVSAEQKRRAPSDQHELVN